MSAAPRVRDQSNSWRRIFYTSRVRSWLELYFPVYICRSDIECFRSSALLIYYVPYKRDRWPALSLISGISGILWSCRHLKPAVVPYHNIMLRVHNTHDTRPYYKRALQSAESHVLLICIRFEIFYTNTNDD